MVWLIKTIRKYVCVCDGRAVTDQTMLNEHRRGLASMQRVNGDIFLQFALVRVRWKK